MALMVSPLSTVKCGYAFLYQAAQKLTQEDAQPRLLARGSRSGDVVQRAGLGTLRALFCRPSDSVAPSV